MGRPATGRHQEMCERCDEDHVTPSAVLAVLTDARAAALAPALRTGPSGVQNIGNSCYLASAVHGLLASTRVRSAFRGRGPRLQALAAAAAHAPHQGPDHIAPDGQLGNSAGTLSQRQPSATCPGTFSQGDNVPAKLGNALAQCAEHVWGGAGRAYDPRRLHAAVAAKSVQGELGVLVQHDANLALYLLVRHVVSDMGDAWASHPNKRRAWEQAMCANVYEAKQCNGRGGMDLMTWDVR